MKALGGSYLKFPPTYKQRDKERVVLCLREIAPSRQETFFLVHHKRVRNGFFLAVSFQQKCIRTISASSSAQTNDDSEEIQTMHSDQPKTVRVRFKLHKECAFGQQFLIVGDDPIVGLWDPSDGVPLIWSEGHVWTAEMDIASGKVIKYKFILKGDSENISWQPGSDRILETWYNDKTITVFEDWDNAELQNIVEEEIVADVKEESLIDSDLFMVVENLNQPIIDKETYVINELANAIGHKELVEKSSAPMVAENITEELEGQDLSSSDKGSHNLDDKNEERKSGDDDGTVNGSDFLSSKDEKGIIMDEGVIPVLVPGLIPTPPEEIEEAGLNQVEIRRVEKTIDEIEDPSEPEETSETTMMMMMMMMIDQKQQINGTEHILESDLQWGRRTLQKFIANFGFQ